jgi:hypothetical protein
MKDTVPQAPCPDPRTRCAVGLHTGLSYSSIHVNTYIVSDSVYFPFR